MRVLIVFLSCFFLSLALWGQPATPNPTAQKVLQLHIAKFRWMVHKQTDSLLAILDHRVQYVHSNGWVQNKQEIIDDLVSGKLIMNQVLVQQSNCRLYHKTAIINGQGLFTVQMAGKEIELTLKYTEVYIKRRGHWWLVSRHANKMGS